MLFVDNPNHDPFLNLALEEHLMRGARTQEDLLLLYINDPSIIIGCHQNAWEEVNLAYAAREGIPVARRMSGGGTVYHDLGNLNYSYVTDARPEYFRNFKLFTAPILRALADLGIPVELSPRNDLLVGGRKVSGTAQYISRGRMISHGTLLFSADLSRVSAALRVEEGAITSKSIRSVRSAVTNLRDHLARPMDARPMDAAAFRAALLASFFPGVAQIPQYELCPADWAAAFRLAEEQYRTWEWIYGRSPDFSVVKRAPGGEIEARLEIRQGLIHAAKLSGDFFAPRNPAALEQRLAGVRYERAAILRALSEASGGIDAEVLAAFLC